MREESVSGKLSQVNLISYSACGDNSSVSEEKGYELALNLHT